MRVLLLGGSGFIGRHLARALVDRGDDVSSASLRDARTAARIAAECDAVVNLAGESLAQRWNAAVKDRIRRSRTDLSADFLTELAENARKPAIYISASAIGYYGTSETATLTESSPPGSDFLASVCVAWEQTAQRAADLGMRVACVRAGLVLGADGGALAKVLPMFLAGTGGRAGSGRQWYSWIHIDDAVGIYLLALDRLSGAVNATAPNPVRNAEFTQTLSRVLHRPAALPTPAFALRLALGEGAALLLEGQRVLPERALAEGYEFKFPTLDSALRNLLA